MRAPVARRSPSPRGKTPVAVRGLVVALVGLTLTACGQTTTETVTRTVTKAAATTTAASPTTTAAATTTRQRPATRTAAARRAPRVAWTPCDPNVAVVQPQTSCGFAQNAFYEYWSSGEASTVRVYSPALGVSLTTRCTGGVTTVVCRTGDGGRARFRRTALDAYSSSQAEAYASTHDLGADSTSAEGTPQDDAASSSAEDEGGDDGVWPPLAERIPNFDEGTGSVVQCADGMYSQSGGRPGACSGHGGVG